MIPGLMVSEQDIRVEKSTPSQSDTGEVEMQIRIKNLSQENDSRAAGSRNHAA